MPDESTLLKEDFQIYEQNRKAWVKTNLNEFVVICRGVVAGFYRDYEAALRAGVKQFGVQNQFLIKQICTEEPVFVIY